MEYVGVLINHVKSEQVVKISEDVLRELPPEIGAPGIEVYYYELVSRLGWICME